MAAMPPASPPITTMRSGWRSAIRLGTSSPSMSEKKLIATTTIERRDARYGIGTMCIGFGQALACVVERV